MRVCQLSILHPFLAHFLSNSHSSTIFVTTSKRFTSIFVATNGKLESLQDKLQQQSHLTFPIGIQNTIPPQVIIKNSTDLSIILHHPHRLISIFIWESAENNDPELSVKKLKFTDIDILNVLEYGTELVASGGTEYEDLDESLSPQERLEKQRKALEQRMGLVGQFMSIDEMISDTDFVYNKPKKEEVHQQKYGVFASVIGVLKIFPEIQRSSNSISLFVC
jgi:hypothetical protein